MAHAAGLPMPELSLHSASSPKLPERYTLIRHIANGGMAAVWEAEDGLLGRPVAVKVLSAHLAEDERNVARFAREARAAARVSNHPHVVTIYDVGEHGGRSYIVMEYVPGGSVADATRAAAPGGVPHADVLTWLSDASAALDAAHAEGIVHRDIKPANLLIGDHRRALVADFGLARLATEATMTSTGEMLGTAAYLSPEQALGQSATAASDRYSLAVVAYELLTGTRPFRGEHFAAQARQHVEATPAPASEVAPQLPAAVDAVIGRGLAKEPAERWPTAASFVEALREALAERADPPTEPTAPADLAEPTQRIPLPLPPAAGTPRHRARWAALGVTAAALVAAVVVVSSLGGDDPKPSHRSPHARAQPKRARARPVAAPTPTPSAPSTPKPATPASAAGASSLQARGHSLLAGGSPAAAVPLLRQAVSASGGSLPACRGFSTPACETYAFALYDLGRALRLSGHPAEAVPVLQQRVQIQNQVGVVQRELALAQRAAR